MANSRFISGIGITPFKCDTPKELFDGLEPALRSTIPTPGDGDLADIASESIHPTDLVVVSSYNWVYGPGKRLKIIVPGYPPCWAPPTFPTRLPMDTGFRFIHQNDYFSPGTPLRPLLRAVYTHQPDINIKEFDFILDRNNLIKLFKFVRGDPAVQYHIVSSASPGSSGSGSPPRDTASPSIPPTGPSSGSGRGRGSYSPSEEPGNSPTGGDAGRGRGNPPAQSWRDRHPPSTGWGLMGRGFHGGAGLGYNPDRGRGRYGSDRSRGYGLGRGGYGSERGGYGSDRGRGGGRYIQGVWSPNWNTMFEPRPPQESRIDVDIMGGENGGKSSMLLTRWDACASEIVKAGDFRGWGYQFLAAFTKFGDAGEDAVMDGGEAQSYHRIISYNFGGYKFLVRYHTDAVEESLGELRWWAEKNRKEQLALKKAAGESMAKDTNSQNSPGKKADDWLEKEFVEGLSKLNFNSIRVTSAIEAHRTLTPLYQHSSVVGIKTTNMKNSGLMMARAMPQVFFSQTPHLYVGYHEKGTFERVDKIETATPLAEWEKGNEVALKKLLTLLGSIRKVVEGIEGRRASIIFTHGKEGEGIKVYKRQDGTEGPVPSDLVAKWD